ncbi:hypothetical protein [Streptomyces sp. SID14515]|uniref:hypothetical protein n=1 Tax=Streptomyces sp. SID14515 TaxID=2706074 RepID=UPI0013CB42ED|nr:hypothetical protein [Streptomyces sp. SID14515]NEB39526.1 hypothetical protein [Streptomyces sp. SID14515]
MNIHQVTILRAHLLTLERAQQLAALRLHTGIQLVLHANPSGDRAHQALLSLLTSADLHTGLHSEEELRAAITHHGAPATRVKQAGPDHHHTFPNLPTTPMTGFRADLRRRLLPEDQHQADGQYRAALQAAAHWLTQRPHSNRPHPPDLGTPWNDIPSLQYFLSRLTHNSPTPQHTLIRIRGAQAGFLRNGLLLDVPEDLDAAGGPGITTRPCTPKTVQHLSVILGPTQAAGLATLLFTGAHPDLVASATVDSVTANASRIHLPAHGHIHGHPTGQSPSDDEPRSTTVYAVPPRARPLLHAALLFRQREQAPAHFRLFSNTFGHRLTALTEDLALPIPTLVHPHPAPDWHQQARCWHIAAPLRTTTRQAP